MADDPLWDRIDAAMRARGLAMDLEFDIQKKLWMEWIGLCALKPLQEWFLALADRITPSADDDVDPAPLMAKLGQFGQTMYASLTAEEKPEIGIDFLRGALANLPSSAFDDLVLAGILVYKLGDVAATARGERAAFVGDGFSEGLIDVMQGVGKGAIRDFPEEKPSDAFLASLDATAFVTQFLRAASLRAAAAGILD